MSGLLVKQTVETFLRTYQLQGRKLVVGVSGGADSMALLHGLREVAREWVTVVHVDHGLRESSADDARHVQQICARWNIPCIITQISLKSDSEDSARQGRYRALSETAQAQNAAAILTAHHADDQVETVLLNLMRGTGVDGLSGMSAVSSVPYAMREDQRLYRPLLPLTRSQILAYCQQNSIPFVDDATNSDTHYTRNRVRHELLPLLEQHAPQIRKRLLQLAEVSSTDAALLQTLTEKTLTELLVAEGKNWLALALAQWRALPLGLRRRTLRLALHILDNTLTEVGFGVIEEARRVAEQGTVGKQTMLPNGWRLTVGYDRLVLGATIPPLDVPQIMGEVVLEVPGVVALGGGWELSAEIVKAHDSLQQSRSSHLVHIPCFERLTVRGRRTGERMQPFGSTGSAKLKRLMIDHKIPQRARANWPLVVCEDQIVWFVGEILGEAGRLEPNATTCIQLKLIRPALFY